MKLIAKELSYAAIIALTIEAQDDLARSFVKGNAKLKDTRDEQNEGSKVIGKLLCVLEERLEKGKTAMAIAPNKTLKEFFKDTYGAALQNHPYSLKNAFGAFVRTALVTELDYDVNSGNCLELAGRIVTACNGNLEHQAVKDAAFQLKERSNKAAKNLREILLTVKPAAKMTAEETIEMMETISSDGQLAVAIAVLPDLVLKMTEEEQLAMYGTFARALQAFDEKAGHLADAYSQRLENAEAPIHVIKAAA